MAEGELISRKTPEEWAALVETEWRKTVQGIIATGQAIDEALTALDHGEKMQFYGLLPFSQQTANKLVRVAKDQRILNYAQGRNLPTSWRTLKRPEKRFATVSDRP